MKMKSRIRTIEIFLSMLLLCIIATACEKVHQDSSSVIAKNSILIETTTTESSSMIISDEELIEVTNLVVETIVTSRTTTVANDEKLTEKQLVKEILMIDDPYYTEEHAEEDAEWMIHAAEPLSEFVLGSIDSEDDAKEKGRAILVKWAGQKFIDDIESDFVIHDGKQIKFERDHPPYSVIYYEKYDAWFIKTDLPSGKTEDGGKIATPGTPSYVILRGVDGKVLAIC